MRSIFRRLRSHFSRKQLDRELDEEIRSHVERLTEQFRADGVDEVEARRRALVEFGGLETLREEAREAWGLRFLEDLARDIRQARRMLTRTPGQTAVIVALLAIGIAANSTVFTVVNGILLRDLPFDEPDRIVALGTRGSNFRTYRAGVSYPDFRDWQAATESFDDLGVMREATMNVGDDRTSPERFVGSYISANAFRLIGKQPVLGRDFLEGDDRPGAAPVVIIGHSLWRNRYASDPGVVGTTIRVNGVPSIVIGVMPDGFSFPTRSRLWQPVALLPEEARTRRDARDLSAFGRLADGVQIEQAAAELSGIGAALDERYPETNEGISPIVAPYRYRSVGGNARSTLPVLMGVVALVLLMACANVANLLLACAAHRSHEIAIRTAIGAGRLQIIRQLLVEGLLFSTFGGVVGWALSVAAIRIVSTALPSDLPYWIDFTMDGRVLVFLVAVSLGTTLLFGLVPALQASRPGSASIVVETGRTNTGGVRRRRWASGLVVFQLALTPILLAGGGLMMRSIVAQFQADAGVEIAGITWARLDLPELTYAQTEDRVRFYRQLDERLAATPGVVAALASHAPFGGGAVRNLWRDDELNRDEPQRPPVLVVTTGPRYFSAFRTGLVRGSEPALLEAEDGAASVIVNQWLAGAVFPGEDPIGRRIHLAPLDDPSRAARSFTIGGIAPDIRQGSTEDANGQRGVAYVSYGIDPLPGAAIVARSDADTSLVGEVLREQVRAVDPDLPLFDVMTLDDNLALSDERVGLRVFGTMFVVFALVALLLATAGLYAVTAYAAFQRTREIGIRVALGARANEIWWLVIRAAVLQLSIGLSIGMLGAVGIGQLLESILVGISPTDPVTLFGIAGVLAAAGFCACFIPARRALRLDPAAVLRSD
jgi:putative ABC transport system permease protein